MKSEGQILQKKLAFKQLDDWKCKKYLTEEDIKSTFDCQKKLIRFYLKFFI